MPSQLTIDGVTYIRIPRARVDSGGVAVYKGPAAFLRLGATSVVSQYRDTHARMEAAGYPVAKVTGNGHYDQWAYYVEESLGEQTYARSFSVEFDRDGTVSDELFDGFVNTCKTFLVAQLSANHGVSDFAEFARETHIKTLIEELPQWEGAIERRLRAAMRNLREVPFVLSHGDFNPANLLQGGVIDIENAMSAPLGYDAVTAVETPDWFLRSEETKAFYHYVLTDDQKSRYRAMCEDTYRDTVDIRRYWNDFVFFRAAWMTVRMHKWPQVQQYRYDRFIRNFLQ